MNIAWELFVNLLEVAIIYDFLIRYLGYQTEKKGKYAETIFWGMISFAAITIPSILVPLEVVSTLLSVGINYIFCTRMLNGTRQEKAFLSVFVMALVAIAAVIGLSLFGGFSGAYASELIGTFSLYRIAATIFAKILLIWFTRIALRCKAKAILTLSDFLLLFFIPLFSIIAIFMLWMIAFRDSRMGRMVFILTAIIALMDILVYILFRRISADNQVKQEYALLKLQYDCIKNTSRETQHIYEEMQRTRHDIKNHLYCIDRLAAGQKCDENQQYIQNLLEEQQKESYTIVFTGNDILDAILNTKISIAEQQGIRCSILITHPQLPISQSDICVLFGNLLDNAIEAAIKTEEKTIDIQIAKQGEYAYMCVQNAIRDSVLSSNPKLRTSKRDNNCHGFGVQNIKRIVDTYHGVITFDEKEGKFICDILIPLHTNLERKTTKLEQGLEI